MDEVRLIASDMDHTLLDEQGELPPGMDDYLDRLTAAGITFVAASGRPLNRLQQMFPSRAGIAYIGNNGGTVSYGDTVLFQSLLSPDSYRAMAELTLRVTPGVPVACAPEAAYVLAADAEHEAYLGRFNPRIVYIDNFDELDADVDKFSVYLPQGDSIRYFEDVFHPAYAAEFSVTTGSPVWVDLMNPGVHKGHGLRVLADHLGLGRHQLMAFGDAHNDLEMLDEAEHSYAVRNAHETVRQRARFIAESNADHGVLQVIRQLLDARDGVLSESVETVGGIGKDGIRPTQEVVQ
ncbi:MAG: HAD family hydrolase [Micropruina sp.]|uniref:HAD family hydrolase n=1 Tax=Micropruina sp. TaxID=2737536 RepID=UPI0039E3E5DB